MKFNLFHNKLDKKNEETYNYNNCNPARSFTDGASTLRVDNPNRLYGVEKKGHWVVTSTGRKVWLDC